MAKRKCKIVDFPRNCKMKRVATCFMTDGNGSCYETAPSFFEEMTRCRRQKHHRRWPGNLNGWSKFRNIRLFTFTRSQLMLQRRHHSWRQLPEVAQTACSRRKKNIASGDLAMTRIDRNSVIAKCMPMGSSRTSQKTSFLLLGHHRYDSIVHCFFPTITCNGFCYHLRKIISWWPSSPPKNRDIHIVVFFVESIYSKTIYWTI